MLPKEELLLIIYFVVVISLLTTIGIVFFITFQRRKNKLLFEKFEAQQRFEQEIARSRLEIQEQTLKNVSWELHDNIGQLLSVANMQLNILAKAETKETSSILEIREVVGNSLQEVRSLSRSLNSEVVDTVGLVESVKNEISRFNRLNIIEADFSCSGEVIEIPAEHRIILFRVLQEAFSNILKHSKAQILQVNFTYLDELLEIEIKDNGEGFDMSTVQKGAGLLNMKSRADIIGAEFSLKSSAGAGTSLTLQYPYKR